MKKFMIALLTGLFLVFWGTTVVAAPVLYDWAIDVNETIYQAYPSIYEAPEVGGEITDVTGFNYFFPDTDPYPYYYNENGESIEYPVPEALGTVTVTFDPGVAGTYYVNSFFDVEIDEWDNTYFYNEYGTAMGDTIDTADITQSWEIDEPWGGDIIDNFFEGSLDNANNVPDGWEDDVSMAMGWDFALAAGDSAIIELVLGSTAPTSGFYLAHTDPDSNDGQGETIYFSSTLDIQTGSQPIPEPATLLLLGSGFAGLIGFGRKKLKS